ncbi:site-specific DNA-methyltransferase [Paenibacillus ginsengihumi]|uniref:site-specific DNA-methyltransferase n=1 Tax=Paenibacillus ginsengihumi TaxID=431596 RepID=UPI000378FFA9|nr:site-specific DNA-methyltransferase [Paenibacillus ginsengihumi]
MNKLNMKSVDLTQANIEKIAELFPNVITEARDEHGKVVRAVDFDLLKQELSDVLVEGEKERYQLTWPGKKQAILNANTPTDKTLRPVKEDSVDWDNTQNLYIEGDNLEVLKLLQESYLNKIKMIYIDPPYNTGNDFIYKDDFKESSEEYLEESGQIDENGIRLVPNPTSNGRFHSDWMTMISSRLKIARNLLREDGVIFISIDDNEVDNLKKLCDDVFGADNFIEKIVWKNKYGSGALTKGFANVHEYILCYSKNPLVNIEAPLDEESIKEYEKNKDSKYETRGGYITQPLATNSKDNRPNLVYPLIHNGVEIWPEKQWIWSKERLYKAYENDEIVINNTNGKYSVRMKQYLKDENGNMRKGKPVSILNGPFNQEGTKEIKELFDGIDPFGFPKPSKLIEYFFSFSINNSDDKDGIYLDFFSGSATSAHAVMNLNAKDGGNRKYILVQLPEINKTDSQFANICELGKERIRRAAKKIKEETGADIDYGFRVFRVDSSNMKDVYYTPDKLGQMNLDDLSSNIKEDRTGEDLLIQVMLECGLELSLPMETKEIEGKTVHYVAENSLIACFDEEVPESVIKKIAADQPLRVVFRDSSFRDDSARINVEELFKLLSPSTEIQVL